MLAASLSQAAAACAGVCHTSAFTSSVLLGRQGRRESCDWNGFEREAVANGGQGVGQAEARWHCLEATATSSGGGAGRMQSNIVCPPGPRSPLMVEVPISRPSSGASALASAEQ